jgi:hypothetical protein
MFLQAYTMASLVCKSASHRRDTRCHERFLKPHKYFVLETDRQLLTALFSKKHSQVDAKRHISGISRRPFSDMLHDILQYKGLPRHINQYPYLTDDFSLQLPAENYPDFFKNAMKNNENFSSELEVPERLSHVNYAEIWCEQGRPLDLSPLLSEFDKGFINELELEKTSRRGVSGLDNLKDILKLGILGPVMLRHMKNKGDQYLFSEEGCYEKVLRSVTARVKNVLNTKPIITLQKTHPDPKKAIVNGITISTTQTSDDFLSPPLWLNCDNSMGHYKSIPHDLSAPYESERFGSAIVEFRNVDNFRGNEKFLCNPDIFVGETIYFLKEIQKNT